MPDGVGGILGAPYRAWGVESRVGSHVSWRKVQVGLRVYSLLEGSTPHEVHGDTLIGREGG